MIFHNHLHVHPKVDFMKKPSGVKANSILIPSDVSMKKWSSKAYNFPYISIDKSFSIFLSYWMLNEIIFNIPLKYSGGFQIGRCFKGDSLCLNVL